MRPLVAVLLVLSACASTPGARPHDMSAAQHEAAAGAAEKQAAAHEAQVQPNARAEEERCSVIGPSEPIGYTCWTDVVNPTRKRADRAAELRRAAADHRAASQALRDAETRACVGLSADDRDMGPFTHTADILKVEPLAKPYAYRFSSPIPTGAAITLRAVPGLTVEKLQHIVDCHLARNAALGHDVPEMPLCPLVPRDVNASVKATDQGLRVEITSSDDAVGREVLHRAQALVGR